MRRARHTLTQCTTIERLPDERHMTRCEADAHDV
jgi:hypothetical protein